MLVKLLTEHGVEADDRGLGRGPRGRKEVYADYKAQRTLAARPAQAAVAAPRAARRRVRLPQRVGRGLRGRRRDRDARRAGARRGHPGHDRHRRPRRLPADRPRLARQGHGDGARDHRDEALRPRGGDRALRDPARADPRLLRPQGRHVRQHPRRPGHRRQDRGRPAAALRRPRDGARLASTRSPAPSASRTSSTTPTTRASPSSWRRSSRDVPGVDIDLDGRRRARARPLAAARGLPRVRAARPAAAPRGGAGRRRRRRAGAGGLDDADGARCARARVGRHRVAAGAARSRSRCRRRRRPRASCSREETTWRFGAAAGGGARRRRPTGPRRCPRAAASGRSLAHDAKSLGAVPADLVHDTLLGAFLLEPARRGFPFRELCEERGLRHRPQGPGRVATRCSCAR